MLAVGAYSAGMKERRKIVYTVRDIPESADCRVREVAEAEGVSLNTAALRLIERGLGGEAGRVRRRDLRSLLDQAGRITPAEEREWRDYVAGIDVVDPEAWR